MGPYFVLPSTALHESQAARIAVAIPSASVTAVFTTLSPFMKLTVIPASGMSSDASCKTDGVPSKALTLTLKVFSLATMSLSSETSNV